MRLLLLLLMVAGPAAAQPSEAVRHFDEGNRHYEAGAYDRALDAYQQALGAGYASGALYLNMGNAYFRQDELGQAIRFYEKARRLLPPDDAYLRHNLTVARSRIETPISALPPPVWRVAWERLVLRHGALPFFVAGLFCYALAAVLFGFRLWTRSRNAWLRRALAVSAVLGIGLLAIAFGASLDHRLDRRAVVVEASALHDAPDGARDRSVPEGIVVEILDAHDAWVSVRLPDGTTGWLPTDAAADV